MKKTVNINVAGFPFTIDDDAYILLNDYLATIQHAFAGREETTELASDIESRVAELLFECTATGSVIITATDVENVIRRIGQPDEIFEDDSFAPCDASESAGEPCETAGSSAEGPTPPPYIPPAHPVKKKLFRDPQNAMLGGVCSGFAWYLNSDPTVVRLLTVLIAIISLSTGCLAYLVLWIVVPEARTPLQRMQMMGEEPTVENIGKTVTDTFKEDNAASYTQPAPAGSANFGDALAGFFGICAKVLVIIGLIIGIPLLIALGLGLIGCVFSLIMFGVVGILDPATVPTNWLAHQDYIPLYGVICGMGATLSLGIPLFFLVRMGLSNNRRPLSAGVRNFLVILCIIGFLMAAVSTGFIVAHNGF